MTSMWKIHHIITTKPTKERPCRQDRFVDRLLQYCCITNLEIALLLPFGMDWKQKVIRKTFLRLNTLEYKSIGLKQGFSTCGPRAACGRETILCGLRDRLWKIEIMYYQRTIHKSMHFPVFWYLKYNQHGCSRSHFHDFYNIKRR